MNWTAEDVLAHSAKGTSWSKKDHKYIRKEGKRYIYEEEGENGLPTGAGASALDRKTAEYLANKASILQERTDNNLPVDDVVAKKAIDAKARADAYAQFGAGGMPSNVARLLKKMADKKFASIDR